MNTLLNHITQNCRRDHTKSFIGFVFWLIIAPWLAFFYSQKDFLLFWIAVKAFIPAILFCLAVVLLISAKQLPTSIIFKTTPLVSIFIILGVLNNSIFQDPIGYVRILYIYMAISLGWLMTQQPISYLIKNNRIQSGQLLLLSMIAVVLVYYFQLYIVTYHDIEQSQIKFSNLDKGDFVRVPVIGGLFFILLAATVIDRRRIIISIALLLAGLIIIALGKARQSHLLAIAIFSFSILFRKKLLKGQYKELVIFIVALNALIIATSFFASNYSFTADTSWYTRQLELTYIFDNTRSFEQVAIGHGMIVNRDTVEYPDYFWPSDVWIFGLFFEFGLVGLLTYEIFIITHIRQLFRFYKNNPPITTYHRFIGMLQVTVLAIATIQPFYNNPVIFVIVLSSIYALSNSKSVSNNNG